MSSKYAQTSPEKAKLVARRNKAIRGEHLTEGANNFRVHCQMCDARPTIHPTGLCTSCGGFKASSK